MATLVFITGHRSGGPLASLDPFEVGLPLAAGQPGTWGMVLPPNDPDSLIEIELVEMVDVRGLRIIDIHWNDPDRDGAIGTAIGFPPDGVRTRPLDGSAAPAWGRASRHLQLLIGVVREGDAEGWIGGIRVTYAHAGQRYQDTLPWTLRVFDSPEGGLAVAIPSCGPDGDCAQGFTLDGRD